MIVVVSRLDHPSPPQLGLFRTLPSAPPLRSPVEFTLSPYTVLLGPIPLLLVAFKNMSTMASRAARLPGTHTDAATEEHVIDVDALPQGAFTPSSKGKAVAKSEPVEEVIDEHKAVAKSVPVGEVIDERKAVSKGKTVSNGVHVEEIIDVDNPQLSTGLVPSCAAGSSAAGQPQLPRMRFLGRLAWPCSTRRWTSWCRRPRAPRRRVSLLARTRRRVQLLVPCHWAARQTLALPVK